MLNRDEINRASRAIALAKLTNAMVAAAEKF